MYKIMPFCHHQIGHVSPLLFPCHFWSALHSLVSLVIQGQDLSLFEMVYSFVVSLYSGDK